MHAGLAEQIAQGHKVGVLGAQLGVHPAHVVNDHRYRALHQHRCQAVHHGRWKVHLQVHLQGGQALGQGQQGLGVHRAAQMRHEVEPHRAETHAGQALQFTVFHVQRNQSHAQVAPLAGCNRVFHHPVVHAMDRRLNNHTTANAQVPVQIEQTLFGRVHRCEVAAAGIGKAIGWAKHMHMAVASQGRQLLVRMRRVGVVGQDGGGHGASQVSVIVPFLAPGLTWV